LLALAVLLVCSLIVAALLSFVGNDVQNSTNFKLARTTHYAASGATNTAIQSIRYTPLLSTGQTLNASPPSSCWGSGAPSTLNNVNGWPAMTVWCSTRWNPASAATRVVTLSTCLSSVSATACAAKPLLQAIVTFDDYPLGVSAPTTAQCYTYCGTSMTLNSWVWSPIVPTVTSISPSTGSISGGTSLSITGTGFVNGSTVSFIEESGGLPTGDNVVLSAGSVTVNSASSITAVSPAVIAGLTYFVTVTTPTGSSAAGSSSIFTYTAIVPTVTSISPSTGSISGGTAVTITGTGFINGATVSFVKESGGVPTGDNVVLGSANVTVNSSTSITAVSPAITTGSTYFVTVTTSAGTSAVPASGDVFTYTLLVPTVWSVSPSTVLISGGSTATVTITGTGFITTSLSVKLVPVNSGLTITATSATVNSSTSITAVFAVPHSGAQYYVQVTTSAGTSSNNVLLAFQ
jgi:hypothetical protein